MTELEQYMKKRSASESTTTLPHGDVQENESTEDEIVVSEMDLRAGHTSESAGLRLDHLPTYLRDQAMW